MKKEEAKKEIIDMANALQLIPNTPKGKAVSMALKALEQEPKTGHWKKIATYPLYECSKCKLESMLNTWDYCPNCGCRMVEPQESEGVDADSN